MQSEIRMGLIEELRLRQWARRNYVPAQWRCDEDWHSIVLDEMRRRDAELQELAAQEATPVSETTLRRRIEQGHSSVIASVSQATHRAAASGLMTSPH